VPRISAPVGSATDRHGPVSHPIFAALAVAVLTIRCGVSASAGEGGGSAVVIDPALLTVTAGKAIHLPNSEREDEEPLPPGRLEGGVDILYEKIRLASHFLHFWQTPIVEGGRRHISRAVFESGGEGEPGPEPGRIHIDTRRSQLDSINYRGLLRPSRLTIERQTLDQETSTVSYRIALPDLGEFKGYLLRGRDERGRKVWIPLVGWGDRVEIDMVADYDGKALADPRVRKIRLLAPPAEDEKVRRYALLEIYDTDPEHRVRLTSPEIAITFDDLGQIRDYKGLGRTTFEGLEEDVDPGMDFRILPDGSTEFDEDAPAAGTFPDFGRDRGP